jgi:DNA-binding transcriptional MocR family regulator
MEPLSTLQQAYELLVSEWLIEERNFQKFDFLTKSAKTSRSSNSHPPKPRTTPSTHMSSNSTQLISTTSLPKHEAVTHPYQRGAFDLNSDMSPSELDKLPDW